MAIGTRYLADLKRADKLDMDDANRDDRNAVKRALQMFKPLTAKEEHDREQRERDAKEREARAAADECSKGESSISQPLKLLELI